MWISKTALKIKLYTEKRLKGDFKMKVKKLVVTALIMMLALSAVFAGGSSESSNEITMWSMWNAAEPQGKVLQAAAEAYEAQTGTKVTIEFKGRDISQIIMTALESGENIDLFEDDYNRICNSYKDYCLDLTAMAAAGNYANQSYACFVNQDKVWTGKMVSIAEQPQIGGIWYNKDAFDACGITETPETWEEFLNVCQILKDNGYEPLALDSAYANFNVGYHLDRRIGEAKTTELTKNGGWSKNAGAIAAGNDLIEFVKKGYLASGAPDEYPSGQNKIGLGNAVMVVCAQYVCPEVNNATGKQVNWGYFDYPVIPAEDGGTGLAGAYGGANSLAIPAASKNAQAAFDFALFLTSGEYDQMMADTAEQIPADPANKAPGMLDGTVEALVATELPLSWTMGLNTNSGLTPSIKNICIELFEGKFSTGEQFAAALDALY